MLFVVGTREINAESVSNETEAACGNEAVRGPRLWLQRRDIPVE